MEDIIQEEYKPVLYNKDSFGRKRIWKVKTLKYTNFSKIVSQTGIENGKMQNMTRLVKVGKNIGKKNETCHFTQALSEMDSMWNKKKDIGYKEKEEYEKDNDQKENEKYHSLRPMLALKYKERSHDITFPCYIQPKLDGIRTIYQFSKLWSRLGKEFTSPFHILEELNNSDDLDDIILDGELYIHNTEFQVITSLVRKKKWNVIENDKGKELKFYVFDFHSNNTKYKNLKFEERYKFLEELFQKTSFKHLVLVPTKKINAYQDAEEEYNKYIKEGYEGIMFRNCDGIYKRNFRSKDLQKMKPEDFDEFKVVGYEEASGVQKGCVVWILETKEQKRFKACPAKDFETKKKYLINKNDYIGKYATIRYQGLSTENIPRFPIFIDFRDYE